jgi:hypothetical protein
MKNNNTNIINYSSTPKNLVVWGDNLYSTVGIIYTKHDLSIVKLPENVRSIIIGIILSDGHVALASRSKNAYLLFSRSLAKLTYVYFVLNFLNHYCKSYPKLIIREEWGKTI